MPELTRRERFIRDRRTQLVDEYLRDPRFAGASGEVIEMMADNMAGNEWRKTHSHDEITIAVTDRVWVFDHHTEGVSITVGNGRVDITFEELENLIIDGRKLLDERRRSQPVDATVVKP